MTLGDVLILLFYIWLFISVAVWTVRIYRKIYKRFGGPDTALGDSETGTVIHDSRPRLGGDDAGARSGGRRDKAKAERASTTSTPITPYGGEEPTDLVKAVIREELEKKRQLEAQAAGNQPGTGSVPIDAGPGAPRSGLFAPIGEDAVEPPTVAQALDGIALPCDLVPTVVAGADDPHRTAFVTSGFSARSVAAAFADELERLGYAVRTEQDSVAVARRAAHEVRVEVFEDAATSRVADERQFPYVAKGSVAIVVTT